MATDQGKMSNINALTIAADALGQDASRRSASPPSARPTRRSRSAPSPATTAATCSTRSARRRSHAWAEAHGAVFEDVGLWQRARYFPQRAARTCTPPSPANAAPCAQASASSTPRRSARSRSSGPDAVDVHEPHVHQPLDQARRRPLPLRPAARRGRLHPRRRRHRPRLPPTASTSPPPPAARRACST